MDPVTIAIASAVVTGVATRTGESASTALSDLVRRIRNRLRNTPEILDNVEEVATALDKEFTRDAAFKQECQALWTQLEGDAVSNSFTGQAKNVLQTRDVYGGIILN